MIEWNSLFLTVLLISVIGVGLNAYFPVAAQSMCEKLYPASELVIMTGFMLSANLLGLLGNIMASIPSLQVYGMWVLCGIMAPFVIYIVKMYRTELLRTEMEKKLKSVELY